MTNTYDVFFLIHSGIYYLTNEKPNKNDYYIIIIRLSNKLEPFVNCVHKYETIYNNSIAKMAAEKIQQSKPIYCRK